MSKYTSFAVVGGVGGGATGAQIGIPFAQKLLDRKLNVKVLARPSSAESEGAKKLAKAGAQIVAIDYTDVEKVTEELKGVDVVISTLSGPGFGAQPGLAKAAKAAGVKLFVPSEFGNNTLKVDPSSPLAGKHAFHALLEQLDLPYALVFTGGFAEWVKIFLGIGADGNITIVGDGEVEASFTRFEDAADFVAEVLSTSEPSTLNNIVLPIQGSRYTLNALAKHYQSTHPDTKIIYEDKDEVIKRWTEKHDFLAWLAVEWANGKGVVNPNGEEIKNSLYPGWKPVDAKDLL